MTDEDISPLESLNFDSEENAYVGEFDEDAVSPCTAFIAIFSEISKKSATELPPVYDVINADALNRIITERPHGPHRSELLVEFTYHNHTIRVLSRGIIKVYPPNEHQTEMKTHEFSIIDPSEVPKEQFNTCETTVRKLTELLGCEEMRINQVIVEPGEVTTPHTHEGQEEVFVAMTDGQIAIEQEVHDIPKGGIVRVHPDIVRNLLNQTEDATHIWLAIGAPPVGTVENFGSYVVEDDP